MTFTIHVPPPGFPMNGRLIKAIMGTRVDYETFDGKTIPCRVSDVKLESQFVQLTLEPID